MLYSDAADLLANIVNDGANAIPDSRADARSLAGTVRDTDSGAVEAPQPGAFASTDSRANHHLTDSCANYRTHHRTHHHIADHNNADGRANYRTDDRTDSCANSRTHHRTHHRIADHGHANGCAHHDCTHHRDRAAIRITTAVGFPDVETNVGADTRADGFTKPDANAHADRFTEPGADDSIPNAHPNAESDTHSRRLGVARNLGHHMHRL